MRRSIKGILPIAGWLPDYSLDEGRGDLQAGLTVGVMIIPQAMAYAVLAGVPPIYGLYASLVPLLVYPLFGSSRQLAIGVNAIPMIIVATGLSGLAARQSPEYVGLVIVLTALVGLVEMVMGFARLGFLANLLGRPVISGLTMAAGLIIIASQLGSFLGIPGEGAGHYNVAVQLWETAHRLEAVHLPTLVVGAGCVVLVASFQAWKPLFPGELAMLVVATAASALLNLNEMGVAVVGEVPRGLPSLRIPPFEAGLLEALWPTVVTLAMVQFLKVVSLGRIFAARHKYTIDPNRELLGIGAANLAGSFFQAIPTAGSFSRSPVNDRAGARTPLSNVAAAGVVALTLLFLTPIFRYLPVPALAALIMVAAAGLLDVRSLRELFRTKPSDGWVSVFTFAAILAIGIQEGILLGVAAAVLVILYRLSRPHVAELGHVPATHQFRSLDRFEDAQRIPGLLVLRVEAGFSFFNADFFKEYILSRSQGSRHIRAVIIDGSPINYLDSTAIDALVEVVNSLGDRGVDIHLTGLKGPVRDVVENSGLADQLGADHFHMSPHYAVVDILEEWDEEEGTGMLETYERHREREREHVEPTAEEPFT